MVIDNFYTRHFLSCQLDRLSDGECKVLGSVRFSNIDSVNRAALKEAIESLKHEELGERRLDQVVDKGEDSTAPFRAAQTAGIVMFKDHSVVPCYTNDSADTPTSRIHTPVMHAVNCAHGLAPL